MMLKLKSPFLLIILSILFYSCEKEYSLEGNSVSGSSVFTFTGSPGSCTNVVVTGDYQVGVALEATHNVTLSVDVTATGTYIISTAAINGVSFTGSGTFTTTGTQTISLTGSGIPIAAGTFSFTPGSNGCSFPVTVSSGGGSSGGTAVYTLDGAPGNCVSFSPSGTYAAGTPLGAGNFVTVSVSVTTIGTYIISTNTVNGISFAGTSNFTATGTQTVQLQGTGTPLAGGTFNFIPGTNGCTFSLTVTGSSSGSAVFTYEGAPGTCTSVTPAGTYTSGNPLTASNTVTINVNVTTIGTWSISTPPMDGISFAGSGSFATTGIQSVTLTGTGTPANGGSFDFTPSNNGCSFPITVDTGTPSTDFLKCTMDGVPRTFNVNLTGDQADPTTITIDGEEAVAQEPTSLNISLTKPTAITTGTYNKISFNNTTTYCIVVYLDGTNTAAVWLAGVAPSSAGFKVDVTSYTTTRIEGTFSGTIYSDPIAGTGAKVITSGQFSVPY